MGLRKSKRNKRGSRGAERIDWSEQTRIKDTHQLEKEALAEGVRRYKPWRILIVLALVCSPLALIYSVQATGSIQDTADEAARTLARQSAAKPGQDAALQAVGQWASASSSPFPKGIADLQCVGAEKTGSSTDDNNVTTTYWTYKFAFLDPSAGNVRTVTQLVSVRGSSVSAVGSPSLVGVFASQQSGSASNAPQPQNLPELDQTDSLNDAVAAWAKAYVGSDSDALTVTVADPNGSHKYQAQNLGAFKTSGINWLVSMEKDSNGKAPAHPKLAAASVTIGFQAPAAQTVSQTTLTVLIMNPTTGAAHVVDWSGDGNVNALRKYAHAVPEAALTQFGDTAVDDESNGGGSGNANGSAGSDGSSSDASAGAASDGAADNAGSAANAG